MSSCIRLAAALAVGVAMVAVGGCGGSQAAAGGPGQAGGAPVGVDEAGGSAAPADECAGLEQGRCKITSGCTWSDSDQECQVDKATAVMP